MIKVYVDFEEEDKEGNKKRTKGTFNLIKETEDYIIISTQKNVLQISRKDIRKYKRENK
jgi:hypothetical protein